MMTAAITTLEEQCPEKDTQWAVLMDVKEALEGIGKQKLEQSLAKNPYVATNKDLNYRLQTKYAPLVSCLLYTSRYFCYRIYLLCELKVAFMRKANECNFYFS